VHDRSRHREPASRRSEIPLGAFALLALVLVSTAFRAWASAAVRNPWIAPDEMIYALLGRGLWQHGSLAILGGPTPYFSLLFPAFVGLPLSIGDLSFGYGLLKVLQALVMSLAAVPVYLWGRSLVPRPWAVLAAALTLAVPGLAYSGLVMTEVLFYPLLTAAAWAMAAALSRSTPRTQALLVLATLAAAATRLQAIVLLPVFVGAIVLHAAMSRSLASARRLWPALVAMAAIAAAWVAWRVLTGANVLGGYAVVGRTSYDAGEAARFVLYHAASVELFTGLFPVCALLVLLVCGLRYGERNAEACSYLAVAGSLLFFFVIEVGVFASEYVGRLAERDLLSLAPACLRGFALWLSRGGPRPYLVTSGTAVAAAAALLALPLSRFVIDTAPPDALTLVPFLRLLHATSLHTLEIVFDVGVGAAVLAFALVPRRALLLLPALLLAAGIAVSAEVSGYVSDQAGVEWLKFSSPDPRWVDRAARGEVAYVYDGGREWPGAWQVLFWNRRVGRVYDLEQTTLPGPVPQHPLVLGRDGLLTAPSDRGRPPRYAVVPSAIALEGTPIAELPRFAYGLPALRLWRFEPPMHLVYRTTGLLPNGDIYPGGDGVISSYMCRHGGTFIVTLLVKSAGPIAVLRDGRLWRTLRFGSPGAVWRRRVAVGAHTSGFCTLEVKPRGLTGTTVFLFEP
jgi:hypothetical protein